MRVIDAVMTAERAEALEQRAVDAGHRAVRLADGDRVVLRITCEGGDPDEFLEQTRDELKERCEPWEHYVSFEPASVAPQASEEDEKQADSVAGSDEIEAFVAEGGSITRGLLVLSVLSGILAAAGLLTSNAAVVVGSMVLAPLFKPIAQMGVGVVLGHPKRAARASGCTVLSLILSCIAGFSVAFLTPGAELNELVALRTSITPFDIVIALGAGVAMAYVLVKRDAMAMVGIVVAASIVPVSAALGICVALGEFASIGGAAFTLASNISGIVLGLIVGLRAEQVRASRRREKQLGSGIFGRSVLAGSAVVLALAAFSIWTYYVAEQESTPIMPSPDEMPDGAIGVFRLNDGTPVVIVREQSADTSQPSESAENQIKAVVIDGTVWRATEE